MINPAPLIVPLVPFAVRVAVVVPVKLTALGTAMLEPVIVTALPADPPIVPRVAVPVLFTVKDLDPKVSVPVPVYVEPVTRLKS